MNDTHTVNTTHAGTDTHTRTHAGNGDTTGNDDPTMSEEMAGRSGLIIHVGQLLRPEPSAGPGWVHVHHDTIAGTGHGRPPAGVPVLDLGPDAVLAPGFVDMHVHGGGGHTMISTDPTEIEAALEYHLNHGTTASVISLITAPVRDLETQLHTVAGLTDQTSSPVQILGSHLEGPFLSRHRRGVHPPQHLLDPEPRHLQRLLDAAGPSLQMITMAPELPNTLGPCGAIRTLVDRGVVVAIGHSDADYATATAALENGASVGTHLFNGMKPMLHRDPGPAAAILDRPGVTVELIADGIHVDAAVARIAVRAAGADRLALITDAVPATGAPDGDYHLGTAHIRRFDGQIMLADGSSLGGSDLTIASAVHRAITSLGLSLAEAVNAATAVPAAALGRHHQVGHIRTGRRADLVVLDAHGTVHGVMAAGHWIRCPLVLTDKPAAGEKRSSRAVQEGVHR